MKRSPIRRRTPLRARGAKYKREAEDIAATRQIVWERSEGMCEIAEPIPCGVMREHHYAHHLHHKAPSDRDRGVHDPERCLAVCEASHRFIHANPAHAYERGWLIRDGLS